MPKMIQLRHVPDALHRRLKALAAQEGMSLSDFLIRVARTVAERPSAQEFKARLATRAAIEPGTTPADVVRMERDAR
jgi:plasmid stability protein